ncbi:MAG: cyclic nucleotide-binding domain-containing protein [Deltaproteobacteria bacterium]|nr:cyclic nucleotide-binding domain-containing protein [Deltaproteobacteria bacterium]
MPRPSASDLGKLPLFGGLADDALRSFADAAVEKAFRAGDQVFRESDVARDLYVLESGALEVIKRGRQGDLSLWKIRPGESFGEMSLIDMQPRSASVVATVDSTTWCWGYAVFRERYCADGKCYTLLVMNVARELSRRLRRADDLLAAR